MLKASSVLKKLPAPRNSGRTSSVVAIQLIPVPNGIVGLAAEAPPSVKLQGRDSWRYDVLRGSPFLSLSFLSRQLRDWQRYEGRRITDEPAARGPCSRGALCLHSARSRIASGPDHDIQYHTWSLDLSFKGDIVRLCCSGLRVSYSSKTTRPTVPSSSSPCSGIR
jgi:hypothetical protein